MSNKKSSFSSDAIKVISDGVTEITHELPAEWGDRLNFIADAIGGFIFLYILNERLLFTDQVFMSFVIFLVFMMLCFIATLLMRILDRQEKSG